MIFQYGTMAGIIEGAYSGSLTIEELLKYGNFGIGTFDGIDGEMVILDSKVYKTDYFGNSYLQSIKESTPFTTITTFEKEYQKFDNLTFKNLLEKVQDYLNQNYFYAIKISGNFQKMNTRSPKKQEKPYPPLLEVLENQNIFHYKNTQGTIVGFFSPYYAQGLGVGGFHLHYISNDLKAGGHIFDFEILNGLIEISKPLNYSLKLPVNDEYQNIKIDGTTLHQKISIAEVKN